jgi:hypothetical protein
MPDNGTGGVSVIVKHTRQIFNPEKLCAGPGAFLKGTAAQIILMEIPSAAAVGKFFIFPPERKISEKLRIVLWTF